MGQGGRSHGGARRTSPTRSASPPVISGGWRVVIGSGGRRRDHAGARDRERWGASGAASVSRRGFVQVPWSAAPRLLTLCSRLVERHTVIGAPFSLGSDTQVHARCHCTPTHTARHGLQHDSDAGACGCRPCAGWITSTRPGSSTRGDPELAAASRFAGRAVAVRAPRLGVDAQLPRLLRSQHAPCRATDRRHRKTCSAHARCRGMARSCWLAGEYSSSPS